MPDMDKSTKSFQVILQHLGHADLIQEQSKYHCEECGDLLVEDYEQDLHLCKVCVKSAEMLQPSPEEIYGMGGLI